MLKLILSILLLAQAAFAEKSMDLGKHYDHERKIALKTPSGKLTNEKRDHTVKIVATKLVNQTTDYTLFRTNVSIGNAWVTVVILPSEAWNLEFDRVATYYEQQDKYLRNVAKHSGNRQAFRKGSDMLMHLIAEPAGFKKAVHGSGAVYNVMGFRVLKSCNRRWKKCRDVEKRKPAGLFKGLFK